MVRKVKQTLYETGNRGEAKEVKINGVEMGTATSALIEATQILKPLLKFGLYKKVADDEYVEVNQQEVQNDNRS